MPTTTTNGLPKPLPADPPNGPAQIGALADKLDPLLAGVRSSVATEQSRSSTVPGMLATQDQVTVTVGPSGMVEIFACAAIKEAVANDGNAHLYRGSNVVVTASNFQTGASPGFGFTAGTYGSVLTTPANGWVGLPSLDPGLSLLGHIAVGGRMLVFGIAPGSHTFSMQFSSDSGGAVTVKNRTLLVRPVL